MYNNTIGPFWGLIILNKRLPQLEHTGSANFRHWVSHFHFVLEHFEEFSKSTFFGKIQKKLFSDAVADPEHD